MDVASRKNFRKSASQDSTLLQEAIRNKNHAFHSTAVHMEQEEALRDNPSLLRHVLKDPEHPLYKRAPKFNSRKTRRTVRRPADTGSSSSAYTGSSSSAPTKRRRLVQ
jgi:hypothetical protein